VITGIDHVVILVNDLEEGMRAYRELGFTVAAGGKHPRYTHNALVPFADGTYLELIAFWETAPEGEEHMHRWQRHLAHGGGLIDFAVASDDLNADAASFKQRGIALAGPSDGARSRPDGQQLAWKTAQPTGDNIGALPFIIQDVTPRELRVASGDAANHANGVRGIRSLAVVTADQSAAQDRYTALLGKDAPDGEGLPNLDNADGVYYLIGAQRVDVATPTGAGVARDELQRRGESVLELTLLGPDTLDIAPERAGGARLRVVAG
jgi:catechol 2,3-dioxygenase-like lactoylglutathione lyase family enzyme